MAGAIVLAAAPAAHARSVSRLTDAPPPFGATTITVSQTGPELRLQLKTAKRIAGRKLSVGTGPYVCARLAPHDSAAALVVICPLQSRKARSPSLRAYRIAGDGQKLGAEPVRA